jgi:hypothetical protein
MKHIADQYEFKFGNNSNVDFQHYITQQGRHENLCFYGEFRDIARYVNWAVYEKMYVNLYAPLELTIRINITVPIRVTTHEG